MDHEVVQLQKNDGYYYVNVPILGGRLTSSMMDKIADSADKYESGELRLTLTQNIVIAGVSEENKDPLIKALMDRVSNEHFYQVGYFSHA